MIIAIFSQNWGVILRVIYYTPSYTPQYIGIAIDEMDSMRHKKGLNPLDLSLSNLYIVILRHINLSIWWRWRELNPRPPALRSRILHA